MRGRLESLGRTGSLGRTVVAAVTSLGLAVGVVAATGGPSAAGPEDTGLAQDFVSAGLCDGGPRFRVLFHDEPSEEGLRVEADVLVRHAGQRERWDWTGIARTTFADGTSVDLIADFGRARSTAKGRVRITQSTPAGVEHLVVVTMSRRSDGARCRVLVRG